MVSTLLTGSLSNPAVYGNFHVFGFTHLAVMKAAIDPAIAYKCTIAQSMVPLHIAKPTVWRADMLVHSWKAHLFCHDANITA